MFMAPRTKPDDPSWQQNSYFQSMMGSEKLEAESDDGEGLNIEWCNLKPRKDILWNVLKHKDCFNVDISIAYHLRFW